MTSNYKKPDRRKLRTQRQIREAFLSLVREKDLESITVNDIAQGADINRATFYLHYQDKYDLLEQTENQIMEEMLRISQEIQISDLLTRTEETKKKPLPFAVKIFSFINENHLFFDTFLDFRKGGGMHKKLYDFITGNMHSIFSRQFSEENSPIPKSYLVAYMASAHLGLIGEWLAGGRKESPEEMAAMLIQLTVRGPVGATESGFSPEVPLAVFPDSDRKEPPGDTALPPAPGIPGGK